MDGDESDDQRPHKLMAVEVDESHGLHRQMIELRASLHQQRRQLLEKVALDQWKLSKQLVCI